MLTCSRINVFVVNWAYSTFGLLSDIVILVLPVPTVLHLMVDR